MCYKVFFTKFRFSGKIFSMENNKKKPVRMIQMDTDDNIIDKVLTDGITCEAPIEVGEAVDCLLVLFQNIQGTDLVRDFKKVLGPEHDRDVDKFLMLLLVSEVATLVGNFNRREREPTAKA